MIAKTVPNTERKSV